MKEPDEKELCGAMELSVPGLPPIELVALCDEVRGPADLTITMHGETSTFRGFAEHSIYNEKLKRFPAMIKWFAVVRKRACLFLIGLFDVLFISEGAPAVSKILRFNRNEFEDRGFYQIFVHEYEDFILIRYESGLCRVTHEGEVVWHIPLTWDDIFLRSDDNRLIYTSEYFNDGREWTVSLSDGSRNIDA